MKALLLALVLALPLAGAAAAPAVPQNLTLSALSSGVWRLTWDPILDDRLMGYTVWSRKEQRGEYLKVTKQMLPRAIFQFKGLDPKRQAEFVVVAEYEDERSEASAPAYTQLAWKEGAQAPLPAEEGEEEGGEGKAAPQALSPAAKTIQAKSSATPLPSPSASPTPFWKAPLRGGRSLALEQGSWRFSLGASYSQQRYIMKGRDRITEMAFIPSDWTTYDQQKTYTWERHDQRQTFIADLLVAYSPFTGLELGVDAPWHSEQTKGLVGTVDGKDYSDTNNDTWPTHITAAWGDLGVLGKVQPADSLPLLLDVDFRLPTGRSRFKSFLEYWYFNGTEAGTGMGVPWFSLGAAFGERGTRQGPSFLLRYQPAVTETVRFRVGDRDVTHQAYHNDIWTLGLGYTLPWGELGKGGSAVLELLGRRVAAGRWSYQQEDLQGAFSRNDEVWIRSISGLNLYDDNQVELGLEAIQDLNKTFSAKGRIHFLNRADGWGWGAAGSLVF